MISLNEGNILEISNEHGLLSIDSKITDGMTISYHRKDTALSLCAIYSSDEIKGFLANQHQHLVCSEHQTEVEGKKKVSHTEFSKVNIKTGEENDFKVNLYCIEGFVHPFPLSKEEWDEMVKLMMRVTNGSEYMKDAFLLE